LGSDLKVPVVTNEVQAAIDAMLSHPALETVEIDLIMIVGQDQSRERVLAYPREAGWLREIEGQPSCELLALKRIGQRNPDPSAS
jgi:hypothetical protein